MSDTPEKFTPIYQVVVRRKELFLLERISPEGIFMPTILQTTEWDRWNITDADTPASVVEKLSLSKDCRAYPIATKYTSLKNGARNSFVRHIVGIMAETATAAASIEDLLSSTRSAKLEWMTESDLWKHPGNFGSIADCLGF